MTFAGTCWLETLEGLTKSQAISYAGQLCGLFCLAARELCYSVAVLLTSITI